ncbi:hypothetical protein [Dietzia lutea]|uniref:DUF998 domain-containing protein n=1 Tax=Dietzia lutea TaxID=546160 RepID=A0A2S1R9G1_9ACTN|nr:hypothetical protein [Dietzia lutea]AWH92884.1 hypothetical protein A6035_12710 [Dietzia lutea]
MTTHQPQSRLTTFCDAPADYIIETYFVLRILIAGGALVLPPALVVWALVDPRVEMMDSLSAFYYTPARSLFVGILVAIGVALVAYRGYTRGENLLLNLAGVLAVVVALFPTADPAMPGAAPTASSVIHAVAAVAFFVLASLSIFFYGQETLDSVRDPRVGRRYRVAYRVLVVLVLVFPVLALVVAWLVESWAVLFAVEAAALYAFAAFWLVKTYELARSQTRLRVV